MLANAKKDTKVRRVYKIVVCVCVPSATSQQLQLQCEYN